MKKNKYPVTAVTRFFKQNNITYVPHLYTYEEKGGTKVSSKALNISEHYVIKTLVMENDNKEPLIILMHGDMEVSTKNLARFTNTKNITPCSPEKAYKLTGYQIGGTSPFGILKQIDIYVEKTIMDLEKIIINGGKRGFLIEIKPEIINILPNNKLVSVATKP